MTFQELFSPLGRVFAAVAFLGAASSHAQVGIPPPVEAFFQNPAFSSAKLSPSARYVALGVAPKDGRTQLMVVDVEKLSAKMVAGYANADVGSFEWVNDDRLVYNVVDRLRAPSDWDLMHPGLQVVSRDGTGVDEIMTRREPGWLHSTTRDKDSDDIFITFGHGSIGSFVTRVNTRTKNSTSVAAAKGALHWVLDSNETARVRIVREAAGDEMQYLDPVEKVWQRLGDAGRHVPTSLWPVSFDPEGNLFVVARNGRDKQALYRYDLKKRALEAEPIVSLADYDFDGLLVMNKQRLLGVHYVSDAEATLWLDPALKQVQAKVDALLPGKVNRIEIPARPEIPYVAVVSYSDVDPGNYYVYNTQTAKLTHLGAAMRGLDPRMMAQRDLVRYKARDGLVIPAWLTVPRTSARKNLPLVVLVHEGPWARGATWRWEARSQFLASRGYAVLEPEFRGSTGLGYRHFQAGWKQWGLAMQADLADGVRWAIAQGIADPARVCIAGSDYGGYAALMGLAQDPDLYRCGLSWSATTDLTSLDLRQSGLPSLVGDPEKDAAQLKATSPIEHAGRIKQPVFLAHGGADQLASIHQIIKFRNAVRRHNSDVEWVEYLEEGHTWSVVKNRVDFWTRVEKFLERNLGVK